ncbi:MAG: rod shape-determining protein MreC [Chitinispirillaceae bacterium]|nr:rod shape-determining protein MreC [Chitinispirillaceae bacterium]
MLWIFRFIIRHSRFFSVLLTTLLSLFMISSPPVKQAAIWRILSISIFYPLNIVLIQTNKIKNVFAENRRLKEEVATLKIKIATLEDMASENEHLRKMLNISSKISYNLFPARVVSYDPSFYPRSIVIDAGRSDSVSLWMPVINEQGLVGKVIQVMNHLSVVQLLKDPSNRVSVMLRKSGAIGILECDNGFDFFIRFRNDEQVEKGDTVLTSGLGGIYPKGILVGTVTDIHKNGDPLFKMVKVKISTNLNRLETLFVIKLSPQWQAFRNELDSVKFNYE